MQLSTPNPTGKDEPTTNPVDSSRELAIHIFRDVEIEKFQAIHSARKHKSLFITKTIEINEQNGAIHLEMQLHLELFEVDLV
jgi:hypothetical protein